MIGFPLKKVRQFYHPAVGLCIGDSSGKPEFTLSNKLADYLFW